MKFILFTTLLCLPAFAQDDAGKAALFQQAKTDMLSNFDQRISNLNNAKTCVNSATDGKALKACHDQLNDATKALKDSMEAQKKAFRSNRDELRAKKRAERAAKKSGN